MSVDSTSPTPPAESRGTRAFTDFLRELVGERQGGPPCSEESFRNAWLVLRRGLIRELRRRDLWLRPPSYLGITGTRWTAADGEQGSASSWGDDPLDELVAAAYEFVFVDRLEALVRQLDAKPTIDGLVFLNLRHFLYERQRGYDPLGYRLFKVVHQALSRAIEDGSWEIVAGDPRIRNETVLARPDANGPVASVDAVTAIAERWVDDLMPELVTALGKAQRRVVGRLYAAVETLPVAGIRRFRCGDVIHGMRRRGRQLWTAVFETDRGPTAADYDRPEGEDRALVAPPRLDFEDDDAHTALLDCVGRSLRGDEASDTARLWRLLVTFSGADDSSRLPSRRELARLLDLPKDRIPGLLNRLRETIEGCRHQFRNPAVSSGRARLHSAPETDRTDERTRNDSEA